MTTVPSSTRRGAAGLRAAITGAVAAALGLGCDGLQTTPEQHPIIGGQPDHRHVNVVMISSSLTPCTGTYLGTGRILTAAHCVPPAGSGTPVSVVFVDRAGERSGTLASIRYDTLPDRLREAQDVSNDLARIFVDDEAVPAGVAAMPVLDRARGYLGDRDLGRQLTAVGFGVTVAPTPDSPHGEASGVRYEGPVTLEALSHDTAWVSRRAGDATPCHGDSGGPLLVVRGNVEYLAGVVSEGDCETETRLTRVDSDRSAAYIDGEPPASSPESGPEPGPGAEPEPEPDCTWCCAAGAPTGLGPVALGIAAVLARRRRRLVLQPGRA